MTENVFTKALTKQEGMKHLLGCSKNTSLFLQQAADSNSKQDGYFGSIAINVCSGFTYSWGDSRSNKQLPINYFIGLTLCTICKRLNIGSLLIPIVSYLPICILYQAFGIWIRNWTSSLLINCTLEYKVVSTFRWCRSHLSTAIAWSDIRTT